MRSYEESPSIRTIYRGMEGGFVFRSFGVFLTVGVIHPINGLLDELGMDMQLGDSAVQGFEEDFQKEKRGGAVFFGAGV